MRLKASANNYKRSNLSCYLDIKILVYLNLFFLVKKLGEIGPLFYEISGRVLNI